MGTDVQTEVAKQIKEAVRLGVRICTASVPHRSDDVVRANPELRGRVYSVDLGYWTEHELEQIAIKGFECMGIRIPDSYRRDCTIQSAGSPQLMQSICLHLCNVLGFRESITPSIDVAIDDAKRVEILQRTAKATDARTIVEVLRAGPRTRGTVRSQYRFADGTTGDVYLCILRAIASDPPRLSFSYQELTRRVRALCVGDDPVGSSVVGSCEQMGELALDRFPRERIIEWDPTKQVLDLTDPYLLFFLRWSGALSA